MTRSPDTFRPVRPLAAFPAVAQTPFDPRSGTFVPDDSIEDQHISGVDARKINLLGAKVYSDVTQAIADDGAFHALVFDTEVWDEGEIWNDGNPTRLTIPYSGVYAISGFMSFADDPTGIRAARIQKNGVMGLGRVNVAAIAGFATDVAVHMIERFDAGDWIQLEARQNSGGDLDVEAGQDDNFFAIDFRGVI